MASRGRNAKSAKQHTLEGSFRASLHGERASIEAGSPAMPRGLTAAAKTEWKRVVPLLVKSGILSVADLGTLTAYVTAWADHRAANAEIAKHGTTTEGSQGQIVEHPAVRRAERAELRMLRAARLLGLNPASRVRQRIGQGEPVDDDDDSEFFPAGVVG
jgi:P27 family predicted phage terminase small subunit